MNVSKSWPFDYPARQNQLVAFDWLTTELAKGTKYLILEAPVGSGKSNIGVTYSQAISENGTGNAFILTPQRILQDQYEQSFKNIPKVRLASLYGKSNYSCKSKNTNCEIGSLFKPRCESCPAVSAKVAAKMSGNTVMNYKLGLLMFAYTESFSPRKLMVLDECHTLEHHLVDFDTVTVSEYKATKYGAKWSTFGFMTPAIKWIKDVYLPKATAYKEKQRPSMEELMDRPSYDISMSDMKKLREYDALCDHCDELTELVHRDEESLRVDFVLVHDKTTMSFKRLKGAYSFKKILVPYAQQFLFMSSTVLNKDGFCYDLGIDPKDAAFLSLPSEFPIENRPIVYMPQMKMNVGWNNQDRETKKQRDNMVATIKQLLEFHAKDSGIIHTANFQIAKWLVEELDGNIPHHIHHHHPDSGDDRNDVINAFIGDNKPSVLISPSSTEGLDLKEDLGRFAIFAKVPFGYLGDQWIKKRMEMSSEWYQRRALIDVIQGGGRVVRGPTDTGNVYILDASFGYLYSKTQHLIPPWWKESFTTIG